MEKNNELIFNRESFRSWFNDQYLTNLTQRQFTTMAYGLYGKEQTELKRKVAKQYLASLTPTDKRLIVTSKKMRMLKGSSSSSPYALQPLEFDQLKMELLRQHIMDDSLAEMVNSFQAVIDEQKNIIKKNINEAEERERIEKKYPKNKTVEPGIDEGAATTDSMFGLANSKETSDRYAESMARHSGSRMNIHDIDEYRHELLQNELADKYETWDISEHTIREELVRWNERNLQWESNFIDEKTLERLNQNSFLSQAELEEMAKERADAYNQAVINDKALTNIEKNMDKFIITSDPSGGVLKAKFKVDYNGDLNNPEEKELFDAFNKEVEAFTTDLNNKIYDAQRSKDVSVTSKTLHEKDLATAEAQLKKAKITRQIKLAALNQGGVLTDNSGELTSMIIKKLDTEIVDKETAINVLKKKIGENIASIDKNNSTLNTLMDFENYFAGNKPNELRDKQFPEFFQKRKGEALKKLEHAKNKYRSVRAIIANKTFEPSELEGLYNEPEIINKRIQNINTVWSAPDKIEFKEFNSAIELEKALKSVGDKQTRSILKAFYEEKEIDGIKKLVKRDFMVWNDISSVVFDKSEGKNREISLKGIVDIEGFNATPSNINQYFSITDHGADEVIKSSNNIFESNTKRSEIIEIKNIIQKYRESTKNLSDNERRAALIKLKEIDNKTQQVRAEMEAETINNLGTTEVIKDKAKEVEFSWIPQDKVELLGEDAAKSLAEYRENIAGETITQEKDIAAEYRSVIDKLTKDDLGITDKDARAQVAKLANQYEANISSLGRLNSYREDIASGNGDLISKARQSIKEGLNNKYNASTKEIKYAFTKLKLYGSNIDSIDNSQLLNVLDNAMNGLMNNVNSVDSQMLNILQSNLDFTPTSDNARLLKQAWDINEEERRHYNDFNNRGIMQREKITDEEIMQEYYKNQKALDIELDNNNRLFLIQSAALKETEGRAVGIVQQKETAFLAAASKKNTEAIKITPLNRHFTLEEMLAGEISEQMEKAVPLEHFSEFYELMDAGKLGRDPRLPFTNKEWETGKVQIGDKELPINQFYNYYNSDVRKAQNQAIIDGSREAFEAHKKQKTDTINKKIQDFIANEHKDATWVRRVRIPQERRDAEGITKKTETLREKVSLPVFTEEYYDESIFSKKQDITDIVDGKVDPKNMIISADIEGRFEATVDNFDMIREFYNYGKEGKLAIPTDLEGAINQYHKEMDTMGFAEAQAKEVASSKLRPTVITADDQLAFYNYFENSRLSKLSGDGGVSRILIKDKEVNPTVLGNLEAAKANPNGLGIHLKHDAGIYDVVDYNDKTVTLKQNHILAKDITLNIATEDGTDLAYLISEVNDKLRRRETTNIYETQDMWRDYKYNLDDYIFFGETMKDGKKAPAQIKKSALYNLLQSNYVPIEGATDSAGNSIKAYAHNIALKTVEIDFPWMLADKADSAGLSTLSEFAVTSAIAELDSNRLHESLLSKGLDPLNLDKNNRALMIEAVEDSISEKVKGRMLRGFMEANSNGSGGQAAGLVRVAKKYLYANNRHIDIDSIQQVLREMITPVNRDKELSNWFGKVTDIVNDRGAIKEAMNSEAGTVSWEKLQEIGAFMNENAMDADEFREKMANDSNDKIFLSLYDDGGLAQGMVEGVDAGDSIRRFDKNYRSPKELVDRMELLKNTQAIQDASAKHLKIKGDNGKIATFNEDKLTKIVQNEWLNNELMKTLNKKSRNQAIYNRNIDLQELMEKTDYRLFRSLKSRSKKITLDNLDDETMAQLNSHVKAALLEKNNTFINEVVGESRTDNFIKDFQDNFAKKFNDEVKKSTGTTDNKIKALQSLYRQEGLDVAYQYIDVMGKGNFLKGLEQIASLDEMKNLLGKAHVGSVSDYEHLTVFRDLIPGVKITATATDSKGVTHTFDTADAKQDFQGKPGTVVLSNSGEYLPIVDSELDARKTLFLSTIEPSDLDLQKKNVSLAQKNTKLLIKPKTQLAEQVKQYNIFTNSSVNYDTLTRRRDGGFGVISPIDNLRNFTSFVDAKGGYKAVTLDYETTGLPGKISPLLFEPVQVAIQDVSLSTDSKGKVTMNGDSDIATKFVTPSDNVYNTVSKLAMPENTGSIVDSINADDSNAWLLKNYAKYDNTEVDFNGVKSTKGEMLSSKTRVVDNKVQFAKGIADTKGNVNTTWVDTGMSPVEFATSLQDSALKVTGYLKNPEMMAESFGIKKDDILSKTDFMDFVEGKTKGKFIMGHNISSADAPWTELWGKQVGKDMSKFSSRIIDTMELSRAAYPGRSNNTLANLGKDFNIDTDGMAHLADVDVATTTKIAEHLANSNAMKETLGNMRDPLSEGDFIVKIGVDDGGLKGLEKGVYKFNGIAQTTDGAKVKLTNILDNSDVEYMAPNSASLQREASNNWIKFKSQDDAKAYLDDMVKSDATRTLRNAITLGDAWDMYKVRGANGSTQPIIDRLEALKPVYDKAQENAVLNMGGANKWNSVKMTDLQNFTIANIHKFEGSAYDDEMNKLLTDVSVKRMNEFKAISDYANTQEGQIIDAFIKRGRDRLQAGVIDRADYNTYVDNIHQSIKNVKSEGVKSGSLNADTFTFNAPNSYTLGEVTPQKLVENYGGKYGLEKLNPFSLNLDFSNRTTIENSMWNAVDTVSRKIQFSPNVKSAAHAKKIALNQFIMPIIGESITDPKLKKAIEDNKKNVMADANSKVDIDPFSSNTLHAIADHMLKNKMDYTSRLAPVQEVNTLVPLNRQDNRAEFRQLVGQLQGNLKALDDNAAKVTVWEEGKPQKIYSSAKAQANKARVAMQTADRIESNKQIFALTGEKVSDNEIKNGVAMPFFNTEYHGTQAREIADSITQFEEANLINPTTPDNAIKKAADIRAEADALYTQRDMLTPGQFNHMINDARNKDNARTAIAQMPEFADFLKKRLNVSNVSYVGHLNEQILKEMNDSVSRPIRDQLNDNKRKRGLLYEELYRRASQDSKYSVNGTPSYTVDKAPASYPYDFVGPREKPSIVNTYPDIATLKDKNYTKYQAMKEMGYIQSYTNSSGKNVEFTGKIGLPGQVKQGELDPSKVLVASSGSDMIKGEFSGFALTDLTLAELKDISDNQYAFKAEREMISDYISQQGISSAHSNPMAKDNRQIKLQQLSKQQVVEPTNLPHNNPDYTGAMNEAILSGDGGRQARQGLDNVLPESHFTQFTQEMRGAANDLAGNLRQTVKEFANSGGAKYGLAALAFAGAMALTKQYTSDGGRAEQRPQGNQAPGVDGSYDSEYNNNENVRINNPKTVRVEENGKGLNVKVRAKNRGIVNDKQIEGAISDTMNSTVKTQINIRQTDDRQSLSTQRIQELFSQAMSE